MCRICMYLYTYLWVRVHLLTHLLLDPNSRLLFFLVLWRNTHHHILGVHHVSLSCIQ